MTGDRAGGDGDPLPSTTIEDVAAAAGVSVATVSRAIRGLPNVAPRTRDRVLAVASELDYVTNRSASRLAQSRTNPAGLTGAVAAFVPTIDSWFTARAVSGIDAVLTESDISLVIRTITNEAQRQELLHGGPRWRDSVDATVLIDLPLHEREAFQLDSAGVRLVTLNEVTSPFPSVVLDEFAAVRLAIQHLVGTGAERIALVAGEPADTLSMEQWVPQRRRRAFEMALAEIGIHFDDDLSDYGGFTAVGGHDAALRLLRRPDRPDAIFAMSDEMAVGVLEAAGSLGLDVPRDVKVVGFDDHDVAAMVGLTTVRQPVAEMGSAAARLALALIHQAPMAGHRQFNAELVIRRTA